MTLSELLVAFAADYGKQKHPFLLFDLAGSNENSHTRVLQSLLTFENNKFLPSFLNLLGISLNGEIKGWDVSTQTPAIGNQRKGRGYMDLFIKYEADSTTHYVIVENKIYGAGDTADQLARYIASTQGVEQNDFDKWKAKGFPINDGKDIHVVYLTDDGGKTVGKRSLPDDLQEKIDFQPLNYSDDILPWLQNVVLPRCPWSDEGIMIAGIRQYVASLEAFFFKPQVSQTVRKYADDKEGGAASKFAQLQSDIKELESDDIAIPALKRELKEVARELFAADARLLTESGWRIYFTPSFFLLYKPSWFALDGGKKKNYPSIHFSGNTDAFLKGRLSNLSWVIEHTEKKYAEKKPDFHYDRNAAKFLVRYKHQRFDANDSESRVSVWNSILDAIHDKVAIVDKFVSVWNTSPEDTNPFDELVNTLTK